MDNPVAIHNTSGMHAHDHGADRAEDRRALRRGLELTAAL